MSITNKNKTITVDMSGATGSSIPEADYEVKVKEVTEEESESSGKPYLKWRFEVKVGDHAGFILYHNTSLQPQALFNLKNVLTALGLPVPKSIMKINLGDLSGRTCGVTVTHEVYQGKKRPRITDFYPLEVISNGQVKEEEELEY